MKTLKLVTIFLFVFLTGCVTQGPLTMTPLEIQIMQTREYEHRKDIVFPSVISVFQDLGYTVASADKDTGLITAYSASSSDAASKFWLGITDVSQTKATAFVEEIGSITKVRFNFVNTNKKSSYYGQSDQQDTPVLEATIYQNAFERVENAIFVRSSN